jgi:hypothetical protein
MGMRPLQLLNLVAVRMAQLRDLRAAILAETFHRFYDPTDIFKQTHFFLRAFVSSDTLLEGYTSTAHSLDGLA